MTSSWLLGTWRRDTTMTSNWKRVGHLAYCCDNSKKSKRFKSASCLFIPCPPAIWRKTSVGTWTSPWKEKECLPFKPPVSSSILIPLRWLLCWSLLNSVEISPTARVPREMFLSNSIELWLLEDITQPYPLLSRLTAGTWKYTHKEKGETSTTQIPPFFLCFQPFVFKNWWVYFPLSFGWSIFQEVPSLSRRRFWGSRIFVSRWRFFREEGSCCWCLDSARCPFGAKLGRLLYSCLSMGKLGEKWRWCWLQTVTSWIVGLRSFCFETTWTCSECLTLFVFDLWMYFFSLI